MFRALGNAALGLSKAMGVIGILIGFPAVAVGAWRFGGEIIDYLSEPDISVSARNATLRCFYLIQNQADYLRYVEGDISVFVDACQSAPLAVSLQMQVTNNDLVARVLTGVSAELTLPEDAPEIAAAFDVPWHVTRIIDGLRESHDRRSWTASKVLPKATISQEVWLHPNLPGDLMPRWSAINSWLTNDVPENENVVIEVALSASGHPEPVARFRCAFELRSASLELYRGFPEAEQFQFTGACGTASEA